MARTKNKITMKKLVAITSSQNKTQEFINSAYIRAFDTEKTLPVIIPCLVEKEGEMATDEEEKNTKKKAEEIAKQYDMLVLSGGVDLNPTSYGEEVDASNSFSENRDTFEKILALEFVKQEKPIFGICRGFQLLGQLANLKNFKQSISSIESGHDGRYSDISNRKESMHFVEIFGKYKDFLEEIYKERIRTEKYKVNSWHHQGFTIQEDGKKVRRELSEAVKEYSEGTEIEIIMATQHLIEGFESEKLKIVAVQYHPEEYKDSPIIKYFIEKYLTN